MPFVVKCKECGRVLYTGSPTRLVEVARGSIGYTFLEKIRLDLDNHCPYCGHIFVVMPKTKILMNLKRKSAEDHVMVVGETKL